MWQRRRYVRRTRRSRRSRWSRWSRRSRGRRRRHVLHKPIVECLAHTQKRAACRLGMQHRYRHALTKRVRARRHRPRDTAQLRQLSAHLVHRKAHPVDLRTMVLVAASLHRRYRQGVLVSRRISPHLHARPVRFAVAELLCLAEHGGAVPPRNHHHHHKKRGRFEARTHASNSTQQPMRCDDATRKCILPLHFFFYSRASSLSPARSTFATTAYGVVVVVGKKNKIAS